MASTATTRLRLERQGLGENSATWGAPKLNTVLDLVDEAIGGVEAITISGATTTLTSTNYASDQARKPVLVLTGTLAAASSVIVPGVEKLYLVINNCTMGSYTLTIKTAAGAGVSLPTGPQWVYCNATSVFTAMPRLDQLAAAGAILDMGGYRVTNSATPTSSGDLATKGYVDGIALGIDASTALATLTASLTASLALKAPLAAPTFTSGATVGTGTFSVPLGSVGAPTYTFTGDTNTGIYSSGADSVSLVAGGTARATASSSGLGVTGALTISGAASIGSTLGVTGATTLGSTCAITGALTAASVASSGALSGTTLAASGAATLSSTLGVTGAATLSSTLSVTGSVTASSTVNAAGVILGPAGTVGAPSHSFSGDTNTGIRNSAADTLAIVTGGADRFSVDATGIVRAANDLYWETGTNRNIGYSSLVDHAAGNVGVTVFGVEDGGAWTGMAVTNSRTGVLNSQSIEFKTAEGGVSTTTTRQTITKDGYVEIGQASTTTPGYSGSVVTGHAFWPAGRVFHSQDAFSNWNMNADGTLINFARSGTTVGSIGVTTTATSYNTSSDYRLKTDLEPLTGALDRVAKLKPIRFRFKSEKPNAKKIDGFLAHEVQQMVPEAVTGDKDGAEMQGLDKSRIVPLLVAAAQELLVRVEALEKKAK